MNGCESCLPAGSFAGVSGELCGPDWGEKEVSEVAAVMGRIMVPALVLQKGLGHITRTCSPQAPAKSPVFRSRLNTQP